MHIFDVLKYVAFFSECFLLFGLMNHDPLLQIFDKMSDPLINIHLCQHYPLIDFNSNIVSSFQSIIHSIELVQLTQLPWSALVSVGCFGSLGIASGHYGLFWIALHLASKNK